MLILKHKLLLNCFNNRFLLFPSIRRFACHMKKEGSEDHQLPFCCGMFRGMLVSCGPVHLHLLTWKSACVADKSKRTNIHFVLVLLYILLLILSVPYPAKSEMAFSGYRRCSNYHGHSREDDIRKNIHLDPVQVHMGDDMPILVVFLNIKRDICIH